MFQGLGHGVGLLFRLTCCCCCTVVVAFICITCFVGVFAGSAIRQPGDGRVDQRGESLIHGWVPVGLFFHAGPLVLFVFGFRIFVALSSAPRFSIFPRLSH